MRFRIATAQSSSVDADGFWGVQSDAHGENSGVGHFWSMHPFGFISRAVDPDATTGKGCYLLEATSGSSEGFSWLCNDPRYQSKVPPLSQGSSCQYNSAGAFIVLDSDKQVAIQYQPYTDGTTKAHKVTIGKDGADVPVIELKHGDGQHLLFKQQGAELRGSGNAYFQAKGDNCTLNGNGKVTGSLDVAGGIIPAALAIPLISYISALEALLGTIAGATQPTTAPAVSAFIAATAALKAAIPSTMLKAL